jgi:peptidyl-prolyl cis-trans isomerase SurA
MVNPKLVHTLLFFFTICASLSWSQPKSNVIDKIVAQVGDNIILYSELQGQKQSILENGGALGEDIECELIEQMLYQFLLVNQAELDSVMISDEQVDAEMENRIRQIELSMKGKRDEKGEPITFESFYGKSKSAVKDEFRVDIKKRLQGQEVERGITGAISVSPREVEYFFDGIPKDSLPYINSQLSFQQIGIIPTITKLDKEIAKNKLEDIRKQVVSGKMSFAGAATIYSEDLGSAQIGGRIEATKGMMVKPFEQMAMGNLKPGDVSPVFETEFGYHIMQMVERLGDDYIVNHILVSAKPSIDSLNAAAMRIEKCYELLVANKITWEDAVILYSNDKNTKENKGFITNPYTGEQKWSVENINDVDPQMFLLTDGLAINQISAPINYRDFMDRTEGFRIVRLAERTEPHIANLKDDYNLFRSLAEEKKRNDAILAWIKSRISTAYIRIDQDYNQCVFNSNWRQTKTN